MRIAFVASLILSSLGLVGCQRTSAASDAAKSWAEQQEYQQKDMRGRIDQLKSTRKVAQGWAMEIGPIDDRSYHEISEELAMLNGMRSRMAQDLDWSYTQVSIMDAEVQALMIDDLNSLIRSSRTETELQPMRIFVTYASRATDDPRKAFGMDKVELRQFIRGIVSSSIARVRGHESYISLSNYVYGIHTEWNFPYEELGLTQRELAAVQKYEEDALRNAAKK